MFIIFVRYFYHLIIVKKYENAYVI